MITINYYNDVRQQAVDYSFEHLTHYTKTLDGLISVLKTGLAKTVCPRSVLTDLQYPDFFNRLGYTCLTELPFKYAYSHREKYGHFGVVLTRKWALDRNFQPVIYIPRTGSIYLHAKDMLLRFRNKIEKRFLREWLSSREQTVFPLSDADKIQYSHDYKEYFFRAYKGLLAFNPIKTLLNYLEYDELRCEMEWRSIVELFPYDTEEKAEQLNVAIEETSFEKDGWLHVIKTSPPHAQDVYGLMQTGRIMQFEPQDVVEIICPKSSVKELRKRMPDAFKECRIRRHYPKLRSHISSFLVAITSSKL